MTDILKKINSNFFRKFSDRIKTNEILSKFLRRLYYGNWDYRLRHGQKIVFKNYPPEAQLKKYINKENIFFHAPLLIQTKLDEQYNYYVSNKGFRIPNQFYIHLKNCYLVGPNAIPISSNGNIYTDTIYYSKRLLDKSSPRILNNEKKIRNELKVENAISLVNIYVNHGSRNYFHWIIDCLSLLMVKEFVEKDKKVKIKVIVNTNLSQFQKESLQILGVSLEEQIEWSHRKIFVENFYQPEYQRTPTKFDDIFSPKVINWLIEKCKGNISLEFEGPKRIYISRENSTHRRVINETKILDKLSSLGFVKVNLETISFSDQIRLFHNAEIIISPHGASLTNLIFASKTTFIVELLSVNDQYWYCLYYLLATSCNIRYTYLNCEAISHQQNQQYNLKVNEQYLYDRIIKVLKCF